MHQHPRPAPRSASSANSPQTNPTRTNNQREELPGRTSSVQSTGSGSGSGTMSETGRGDESPTSQNPETARLNLIVQHFFSKAALIIASSRVSLPPAYNKDGEVRMEKWFNTWVEDTNALSQDLQEWKTMEATRARPPPLIIEIYLDTVPLTQNQSLVAVDDEEKRWDVNDALRKTTATLPSRQEAPSEIVYERWSISLDDPSTVPASQLTDAPPNVYKKGVVLLRSLFTYTKFLPAWKFTRRLGRHTGNGINPRPKYRVRNSDYIDPQLDTLKWPLIPGKSSITEDYHFAPLPCSLGCLKVSVTYRSNCNFEIDTAERLLSARFVGGPSEGGTDSSGVAADSTSEDFAQRSGHRPWGRAASASGSKTEELPSRMPPDHRIATGSKSSLRAEAIPASLPRRPSVSFQPFKAGSLSSSPASGMQVSASPSSSLGRNTTMTLPSHTRNRSSLTTLPQQALRTPAMPVEQTGGSSTSSSPKPVPIQRYSSSFGNRRARFPSSGGSKTEEDNNSSRGSVSSTQRGTGSDTLNDAEASSPAPSGDDSESIGDFLKMLEKSSKGLPSFNKTDQAALNANSQRTAAQYSKFARMRESTAQLSDSMSSSLMLQRSSSSSSRQLSNVPGLVGGASVSTSSSPGKPISPHTPHMPAIPSRLSNNSIADYSRSVSRSRVRAGAAAADRRESAGQVSTHDRGTTAIDIPASPRTYPTSRRSSSVHHQQPRIPGQVDDDVLPFGLRSASLPTEERPSYAVEDDEPLLFAMGDVGAQRRQD